MNKLIEMWQDKAKSIYEKETEYMEMLGIKERTFTYSKLAKDQIEKLETTKPDKNKPILDQMSNLQKECYEYLKKVVETNEL